MSWWNSLFGWFGSSAGDDAHVASTWEPSSTSGSDAEQFAINPANGLPMVGGMAGVDIEGNPYGTDLHNDDLMTSSFSHDDVSGSDSTFDSPSWDNSGSDDSWSGSSSSWD